MVIATPLIRPVPLPNGALAARQLDQRRRPWFLAPATLQYAKLGLIFHRCHYRMLSHPAILGRPLPNCQNVSLTLLTVS
jgi:hypothetical protein